MSENAQKSDVQKWILGGLCLVVFCLIVYVISSSPSYIDKAICLICMIGQIMTVYGIFNENQEIVDYGHYVFGSIIFVIPLVTNNSWLLWIDAVLVALTLITRSKYIFGQCMFKCTGKRYSFSNKIPIQNWDPYFAGLLVVLIGKLVYLYRFKECHRELCHEA